jgi:hypothetical protein
MLVEAEAEPAGTISNANVNAAQSANPLRSVLMPFASRN